MALDQYGNTIKTTSLQKPSGIDPNLLDPQHIRARQAADEAAARKQATADEFAAAARARTIAKQNKDFVQGQSFTDAYHSGIPTDQAAAISQGRAVAPPPVQLGTSSAPSFSMSTPQIQQGALLGNSVGGGGLPAASAAAGAGGGGVGLTASGEMYKPLKDLEGEASQYRNDLKNNTGRIANQITQAGGDFLSGLKTAGQMDLAKRGLKGSGVETQQNQRFSDTAGRITTKNLNDAAIQREGMLGGAINSAVGINSAAPSLALKEKEVALNAQDAANRTNQLNFQNSLAASNQAFNQYMSLLNNQKQTPFYSGFSL